MRCVLKSSGLSGFVVLLVVVLPFLFGNVNAQSPVNAHVGGDRPENKEIADSVIQKLFAPAGPFGKYNPANEILEKRTGNSKTFRNTDGSLTAVMAAGPMHYLEGGK